MQPESTPGALFRPARLRQLTSAVFAQMDRACRRRLAAGADVINLSVGSPDLPPADHVVEALARGIADRRNYGYPMADLPAFRRAVADWYQNRFAVALDPETEVLGLSGSQDGLAHLAQALVDPGEVVMVPDPGYPIYTAGPVIAGARVWPVALRPENNYLPDLDAIPATVWQQARLWLINYPSNPLAATAETDFYARAVALAARHNVIICHDAAYSELAFDGYRPGSFLAAPGARAVGIELNSLSKSFNLAGARVAYAVGNAAVLRALAEVKSHLDFGIFRPVQEAAVAALTGPQDCVAAAAAAYQQRRDALVDGLARIGWAVPRPRATMFVWAPLPEGAGQGPAGKASALEFAMRLVDRAGVAVVPGSGFGAMGEGFLRIALVQSPARLLEAVARIADADLLSARV